MKAIFTGKHTRLFLMLMLAAVSVSVSALAADVDVQTVMTTSFQTMADNMMATAAAVLPIVLPILGLSISIMFGIKWFKRLTGKS